MQVQNRLAEIRRKRGVSAAALAKHAGVRRQTIYAIEAGSYIPNTLVSLRLAQMLEVPVEELFSLRQPPSPAHTVRNADLLAVDSPQAGQSVRLCRVGRRIVAVPSQPLPGTLPLADGTVLKSSGNRKATIDSFPGDDSSMRLLVAGCDPAVSILARYLEKEAAVELVAAGCSSVQALKWLKERKVHIAGSHLRDRSTGEANVPVLRKWLPESGYTVVTFAIWEQGLVVARGNPKHIQVISDLARKDVVLVNREAGAGSRFFLDELLVQHGIPAAKVRGYQRIALGHMAAAWNVSAAQADCCVATRAAARAFGLDFIPQATERYDLVFPKRFLDLKAVQVLLDILNRSAFQRELEAVGSYDMSQTGKVVV